jgi:hypothetical protein
VPFWMRTRSRPSGAAFLSCQVLLDALRVKLDFDKLAGLSWRGYPFPFLNGIMSCLCQKWMSALNRDRFCGPVRSDHGFYFHASLQLHTTGEAGILGTDAGYNLAIAFRSLLCAAQAKREKPTTEKSG